MTLPADFGPQSLIEIAEAAQEKPALSFRDAVARVIDDEESVRNSTCFSLRVVGIDAVSYESAKAFLEGDSLRRPGCVMLDVRMPGMSGLELQDEMLRRGIDLPILFLTGHGDVGMAVSALKKGAGDFCEKPADPGKLREAVRRLTAQNIESRKTRFALEMMKKRFDSLTPREKDVIRLVAADTLNKVIALDLGIQEHTVKIHRANACRKLGIRSALDAHKYLSAIGELEAAGRDA